jgi:ABC-2 type transport system permease protein
MTNKMESNPARYSQTRAMLAIARASFLAIIKNPSAVIFSLGFPLIFIVVFGFIKGNTIRLDVGLDPASDTTSALFRVFTSIPNVDIEREKSLQGMEDRLHKGRLDAILKINRPAGGKKQVIEVVTSKASREKGMFVKSILTNIVDKHNLEYLDVINKQMEAADGKWNATPLAELRETEVQGREYKMIDFILPGQLGFSILSAGVFGTAFIFFSLRQNLVLKRFFATPVRRPYIILGEALSRLVFQLTGSLIIIVLGKFVFGFTLVNGFTTLLEMLFLSALGLIVFMGFGFVISGLAKSESVIPPLANIITLPQFLLSGTFFPIDAFPGWLQLIGKALPLTYLNDALRLVAFEGAGFSDISTHILVIVGWGVIIYLAAIRFFKWE